MAIIGSIRKHSGLVVIAVGVAIAAFVIGDFGRKRMKSTNEIGSVTGEAIPYQEFSGKVEEAIQNQKDNSGSDKITDEETFNIRQTTWNNLVKDILMGREYDELGLTVTPDELFDQVQGKTPHRYILQYFKDPKTNLYDPMLVRNYLKNLDNMEPKAKDQWLRFEKAIKEDRLETKFNNLITRSYYMPTAFLRKIYTDQTTTLKIRTFAPALTLVSDSAAKITDADYQAFYDKNKQMYQQDETSREIDYIVFEVKASEVDKKKIADDVTALYKDFIASPDLPDLINANADTKYDSTYKKKGTLPGIIDSTAFDSKPGTIYPAFQLNNAWYMAKLLDVQERPDTIKASQILISFAGSALKNENIKRTKDQAKTRADSLMAVLKKSPEKFRDFATNLSDYPSAKDDAGDLKDIVDGQPTFAIFYNAGLTMKPNEMKVVTTGIGYAILKLTSKSKPIKKVKIAILQRNLEPSNQTFQDIYLKASAFAGQNRTKDAFDKAATAQGLVKKSGQSIREMDNFLSGLPSAREVVRWAFSENTSIGDVSPVFDLTGKYVVAILTGITEKGYIPLEKLKDRMTQAVRMEKKIDILGDRISKSMSTIKDITQFAYQFQAKVDTVNLTFGGYSNSAIGREPEILGQLFTLKPGVIQGPLKGRFGVYVAIIDATVPAPEKKDFRAESAQQASGFASRAGGLIYESIKKAVKIKDNRKNFY